MRKGTKKNHFWTNNLFSAVHILSFLSLELTVTTVTTVTDLCFFCVVCRWSLSVSKRLSECISEETRSYLEVTRKEP